LLYYSGSKGYGFDDEKSDVDVTAVLDNFQGTLHLQLGKIDIFTFSKEEYIKRQNFDESVIDYYKSAADDVFILEDKVIYLDTSFEETYESFKNIDVKSFIVNQLTSLLNYTKMRLEMDNTFKSHYHVFRYRGIIEYFEKTGVFVLVTDEPWFSEMLRYKRNWNNDIGKSYEVKIKEQIEYLERYRDRMIQDGLGESN
jgi:hypothetical protein